MLQKLTTTNRTILKLRALMAALNMADKVFNQQARKNL